MTTTTFFLLFLIGLVCILLFFQCRQVLLPYHVYSISIHKNVKNVWDHLSDPLQYSELYPHWVKEMSLKDNNQFQVHDQFGHTYAMSIDKNIDEGIIKLRIGNELSTTYIVNLDQHNTLVTHVAKKWQGINTIGWILHQRTVAKDFKNAKKVIEDTP